MCKSKGLGIIGYGVLCGVQVPRGWSRGWDTEMGNGGVLRVVLRVDVGTVGWRMVVSRCDYFKRNFSRNI